MKTTYKMEKGYFCFLAAVFLFNSCSLSLIFSDLFSAMTKSGFQSLFLTSVLNFSACAGKFDRASLKRLSDASSDSTISKASSGHASTHFGSPPQRSHAMAIPVSE